MVHDHLKKSELQETDYDTCDANEINEVFDTKCELVAENEIALNDTYILHITGKGNASFNVAVAASNNTCEVYSFDNSHLVKLDSLGQQSDTIIGVQFSPDTNNILYSATVDGIVKLWDLRLSEKLVTQFTDTTVIEQEKRKPITCFDVSPNNRLLAAGTELYDGEAFILFWDVRNRNLLGGYWESHTDDITQVKFQPNDVNTLISGSTDGLINIYDLKHTSEDDALIDSLNTESSIEQLYWYNSRGRACISCITHTVDVQLWKTDGAEPYAHFRRADIAKEIRRKSEDHCYVVSTHECSGGEVVILAGSNDNNGECSRAVRADNKKLAPMFVLKENKQRVRSSWYNEHHNVLVTGGENGILNAWRVKF